MEIKHFHIVKTKWGAIFRFPSQDFVAYLGGEKVAQSRDVHVFRKKLLAVDDERIPELFRLWEKRFRSSAAVREVTSGREFPSKRWIAEQEKLDAGND